MRGQVVIIRINYCSIDLSSSSISTTMPNNLIATGTFDEMLTLASERALADDGVIVIHHVGCDGADDCLCQPRIVRPYESVDEATLGVQ